MKGGRFSTALTLAMLVDVSTRPTTRADGREVEHSPIVRLVWKRGAGPSGVAGVGGLLATRARLISRFPETRIYFGSGALYRAE